MNNENLKYLLDSIQTSAFLLSNELNKDVIDADLLKTFSDILNERVQIYTKLNSGESLSRYETVVFKGIVSAMKSTGAKL
jgi:hypothetical protein